MRQVIVFIVFDQQGANAAFAHVQPLHHRDHHPGDRKVLPDDLEYLVGLAHDDHLIKALPAVIAQRLAKLEFLRRGCGGSPTGKTSPKRERCRIPATTISAGAAIPGQQREDEDQPRQCQISALHDELRHGQRKGITAPYAKTSVIRTEYNSAFPSAAG
jgi:hypothetical protein